MRIDRRIAIGGIVLALAIGAQPGTTAAADDTVALTINLRDLGGALTGDYAVKITGLDDGETSKPYDPDGSLTVQLPKGRYFIDSVVNTTSPDGTRHTHVLPRPNLLLDRDTTVEAPAAAARPVRVTPPDPSAKLLIAQLGANAVTPNAIADLAHAVTDLSTLSVAQLGPSLPAGVLTSMINTQWLTPSGDFYGLAWFPKDTVPTGFTKVVRRNEVATVRLDLGTQVPGDTGTLFTGPDSVSADLLSTGAPVAVTLPSVRTQFFNSDGTQWNTVFLEQDPAHPAPARLSLQGGQREFQPGRSYRLRFNHAPIGPAFPAEQVSWACRCGDTIDFFLPLVGDSGGNAGGNNARDNPIAITLFRDGQLVGETSGRFSAVFPVPPEPAGYRITADISRSAPFDTSTRISAEWTFRSEHVDGEVTLPLSAIRFTPKLDQSNAAPAGRPFLVPVALQPQNSNDLVRPHRLSVDVSYDEGATWQRADVLGNLAVLLRHPPDATSVSLRATAADHDGNTVTETLIRAYKLTHR